MDSSHGQPPSWHQQRQHNQQQEQGQRLQVQHQDIQPPYSSHANHQGPSQLRPPFQAFSHAYSPHSGSQTPASSMALGGRNQRTTETQVSWHQQQQMQMQLEGEQTRRQQASDSSHQPNQQPNQHPDQQQQRHAFTLSRPSDHHHLQQRQHPPPVHSATTAQDCSREDNLLWGSQSHSSSTGTFVQHPHFFSREPASPLPSLAQPFSGTLRSARVALPHRQASGRVQPQPTSRPLVDGHNQNSSPMAQGRAPPHSAPVPSSVTSRSAPYPPPRSHRLPSTSSTASPRLVRDELPQYDPGAFNSESSVSRGQTHSGAFRRSVSHSNPQHSSMRLSNPPQSGIRQIVISGESTLPPRAPISVMCPQEEGAGDGVYSCQDDDVVMEEEDPLEVTLNMDLPKSTRSCEDEPSTTVLNVNPSWHCVFVETVQQGRIRCSLRIQFCGSSRRMEHRALVCQLQSLQVISYQSRQVEMTRRICGKNLISKGGIIVHLDPVAINYNDASYGFTISLSSFSCDRLDCRYHRPDEPLPLTRQQNSAFCRRNLKELYNDTSSKDVAVTLLPSQEQFYVHSVVLENYGYFRTLLEELGADATGHARLRRQGSSRSGMGSFMTSLVGIGDVDEDGFAQPLDQHSFPTTQLLQQQQRQQPPASVAGPSTSSSPPPPPSSPPTRPSRPRISLEVEGVSPNVLRAILHFMYMGHIPTTGASCFRSTSPSSSSVSSAATAATVGAAGSPDSSLAPSSTFTATETDRIPMPAPTLPAANPFDFAWTDLYDAAVRFQLVGLTRLARLVLVSRLEPESAVQELMTWAYQHENIIPCYVSFIIENVSPDHFKDNKMARPNARANNRPGADRAGNSGDGGSTSMLWDYRERCPKFGEILLMIVQMLDERRPVLATL